MSTCVGGRPSKERWALGIATVTATRSTCNRKAVGCVLTDEFGHILSTGYNGAAAGLPHCDHSGERGGREFCDAVHAEQNALLQCPDIYKIHTCYVTLSPCPVCCRLLLNTSCQRIIFIEEYSDLSAKDIWLRAERQWIQDKLFSMDNNNRCYR